MKRKKKEPEVLIERDLFTEPPRDARVLRTDRDVFDGAIYECPWCLQGVNQSECDCIGADDGCYFCPECNGEFKA